MDPLLPLIIQPLRTLSQVQDCLQRPRAIPAVVGTRETYVESDSAKNFSEPSLELARDVRGWLYLALAFDWSGTEDHDNRGKRPQSLCERSGSGAITQEEGDDTDTGATASPVCVLVQPGTSLEAGGTGLTEHHAGSPVGSSGGYGLRCGPAHEIRSHEQHGNRQY